MRKFVYTIKYMLCEFEHLYFGDDGYVIRCKNCCHYQVVFITTLITLTESDFLNLQKIVVNKCRYIDEDFRNNTKSIIVETPVSGICFILTAKEALQLQEMLEKADTEMKALALIKMFNT
ncbi:MAG TPA: DUF6686 family protein [Parafilimonas sp.]|nr:DUF6686 family protein [Parafilimonas sp.]